MISHLEKAYTFDIHIGRDVDERFPGRGVTVVARDIRQGVVYESNGVKITAFDVNHGPVKPASAIASIPADSRWCSPEIRALQRISFASRKVPICWYTRWMKKRSVAHLKSASLYGTIVDHELQIHVVVG
jgi:hypothetical protein